MRARLNALRAKIAQSRPVRYSGGTVVVTIALVVGLIVSTLAIDLGPFVRRVAERYASDEIQRPVRIGSLKVRLLSALLFGQVEVREVSIAGREPSDRPFFTADRVTVSIDWWPAISSRPNFTLTSVEMDGWTMLVEKWHDGSNFPQRKKRPPRPPSGPSRVQVAVRTLRATRGTFTYDDHESSWNVAARNIAVSMRNFPNYNGVVTSTGGTVGIQQFEPMSANLKARFEIEGSRLHLRRIDLDTDGAKSTAVGEIDMAHWPEQTYSVKSRVQFQRMRELFFAQQPWVLSGDGDFVGTFHLFKGGHDLSGRFSSPLAGVYDYRFASLYGALSWTNKDFHVWDAGADTFGGAATFTFSIGPSRGPVGRLARFEAEYANVDLVRLTDFEQLRGLRFAGHASGHNVLEWSLGKNSERHGEGRITVAPVANFNPAPASLLAADDEGLQEWGPFAPVPLASHLPIAGELAYAFTPSDVQMTNGRFVTSRTNVAFEGTTAWADQSHIGFHVTSSDWQESQQVLAGILTDFGAPTGEVTFGGRGEFTGEMTGPFRRPRVEGAFTGEGMRAWDTVWGDGRADIVVENSYVTVKDGIVRHDGSALRANGLFSLGYPRRDAGEEINAVFEVTGRDVDSLRHAFEIDDYPLSGLLSGEFHLTGAYQHPFGFGSMTIEHGSAWNESFERGTASLRFDGQGVRLDAVTMTKGGGTLTGAAYVAWDATYSFNADARRLPMDQVEAFNFPSVKPSGSIDFTAGGSGTFDDPRYDVKYTVNDLRLADEPVGLVTGNLTIRGEELTGTIDTSQINGTGRIAMTPTADAELNFGFHDSPLDPYVRLFAPKLSPYMTAVATGSLHVAGELSALNRLHADGTIDNVDMQAFGYGVTNSSPVRLVLDQNVVRIDALELVGEDSGTRLRVDGTIGIDDQRIALRANGAANLNVLQRFFPEVRGSGNAELTAAVSGPLADPQFFGSATISNGGLRYSAIPNALDEINGTLRFDARSIRLDDLTARMGGGLLQFGGVVGIEGYVPGDLNVIVRGENVSLRVPQGIRSTVDAELALHGNVRAPMLTGSVQVKSALWTRDIDTTGGLFQRETAAATTEAAAVSTAFAPVKLDVHVLVPSTLRFENNLMRLVANADLQLRGTTDRPAIFGRAEVERGDIEFEGRRYVVTTGSVDFTNPNRIEPFFDFEAQTRVRIPGQTYLVTIRVTGSSASKLTPSFESDPPLPSADVVALLFSDVRRDPDVELRALRNPNEREADILATRITQALATPISTGVGRVVEQTLGIDTFQFSPSLIDPTSSGASRVNPSARVTIGKRINDRVFLTFSRSLSTSTNDQILLLEYDASERLSWVLSRNEDQTYAIEVRVRHSF